MSQPTRQNGHVYSVSDMKTRVYNLELHYSTRESHSSGYAVVMCQQPVSDVL